MHCFVQPILVMFWLMLVVGYNLAVGEKGQREQVFKVFSLVVFTGAMLSSFIAMTQWLGVNEYFRPLVNLLNGNRPYANFAQPNNLATFMCMGVFACLYFYEKKILPNYIFGPSTFIFLLTIALTQSRTAWVVCLFTLIYLTIKQFGQTKRFGFVKLLAWCGVFIALITCLPMLNQWIASVSTQDVAQANSVVERATSGYLRLDMWNQALVAISEKPWFGYGWNQTGVAQIAAFDLYPSHEWYKTAHNVILGFTDLEWYPGWWIDYCLYGMLVVLLNKGIKDAVSIAAGLMVCAILIHALLEYPIHYAYFLLPLGFLLGIIQAQYPRLPTVNLKLSVTVSIIVIGLVLVGVIYRDYILYRQQSVFVNKKTPLSASQQAVMNQDILLLTQFKERMVEIGLNPYSKMSDQQLQYMGRMVA